MFVFLLGEVWLYKDVFTLFHLHVCKSYLTVICSKFIDGDTWATVAFTTNFHPRVFHTYPFPLSPCISVWGVDCPLVDGAVWRQNAKTTHVVQVPKRWAYWTLDGFMGGTTRARNTKRIVRPTRLPPKMVKRAFRDERRSWRTASSLECAGKPCGGLTCYQKDVGTSNIRLDCLESNSSVVSCCIWKPFFI